jgi:hypothetical protein
MPKIFNLFKENILDQMSKEPSHDAVLLSIGKYDSIVWSQIEKHKFDL